MDRPGRHPARRARRPDPRPSSTRRRPPRRRCRSDTDLEVEGGTLRADDTNSLADVVAEVRFQQSTARSSIAPAVLSLVLVALALLMRLLNAASELRVPELALASLRGVTARRLWGLGLAEPLALLLARHPARRRLRARALGACSCGAGWCRGCRCRCPWASWVAAALVLVAAFAVACVAVGLVVRESLASQLSGVRRPVAARRWSVIAQLTLVALAVAVLASKLSASGPGEPDATDLVLPVLLAVVAGLAATRLTAVARDLVDRALARPLAERLRVLARDLAAPGGHAGDPADHRRHRGRGLRCRRLRLRRDLAHQRRRHGLAGRDDLVDHAHAVRDRRPHPRASTPRATGSWRRRAPPTPAPTSPSSTAAGWPGSRRGPRPGARAATSTQVVDEIAPDGVVPDRHRHDGSASPSTTGPTWTATSSVEVRFGSRDGVPLKVYLGPFPRGREHPLGTIPFCREGCPLEGMTLGGGAGTNTRMSGSLRLVAIEVDGAPVDGGIDGRRLDADPRPGRADLDRRPAGGRRHPRHDRRHRRLRRHGAPHRGRHHPRPARAGRARRAGSVRSTSSTRATA